MDFWGDAAQVCTAVGGALGGLATIGVAAFGWKLWRVTAELRDTTGELRDKTKELGSQTADLAAATHDLVNETNEANKLVKQAAQAELHALLRPKLDVVIDHHGDLATLYVRHSTDSESERIEELSVAIATQFDRGEPDEDKPIIGPWRFKQGADGADTYGRNADSRGPLLRGVQTRWALSRQTDEIGIGLPPWGADRDVDGPCLLLITVRIGDDVWRYSKLVEMPVWVPAPPEPDEEPHRFVQA